MCAREQRTRRHIPNNHSLMHAYGINTVSFGLVSLLIADATLRVFSILEFPYVFSWHAVFMRFPPLSFRRFLQDCIVQNDKQTQSHVYNLVLCEFRVKLLIHIPRHVHEFAIVNILIIRRQIYGSHQRDFPIRLLSLSLVFSIPPSTSSPASSYEFHSLTDCDFGHTHPRFMCADNKNPEHTRDNTTFFAFISPNQRQ